VIGPRDNGAAVVPSHPVDQYSIDILIVLWSGPRCKRFRPDDDQLDSNVAQCIAFASDACDNGCIGVRVDGNAERCASCFIEQAFTTI